MNTAVSGVQPFPTYQCPGSSCTNVTMRYCVHGLFLLLVSAPAVADIYAYLDDAGVTHFSNVPVDSRFEVVLETGNSKELPPIHPAILSLAVRYDPIIRQEAKNADIEPELLRAVIVVESGFDVNAVSSAGAKGLMQLMPRTAVVYGVEDVFDAEQNIRGGARYLRDLIDRYDDYELVLAAYNAGEDAVEKYGKKIPPYAETRRYVPKVMNIYNKLLQMTHSG